MPPAAQQSDDELLLPDDVAAELKVSNQTIRRWVRAGKIAHVRTPSGRIRIRRSEIRRIKNGEPVS